MGGSPMTTIGDLASIARSKNAGPFRITFDIFFSGEEDYRRAARSTVTEPDFVAGIFSIPEEDIMGIYEIDRVQAIKITIKRPIASGHPEDKDVYGAQQHTPLLSCEI